MRYNKHNETNCSSSMSRLVLAVANWISLFTGMMALESASRFWIRGFQIMYFEAFIIHTPFWGSKHPINIVLLRNDWILLPMNNRSRFGFFSHNQQIPSDLWPPELVGVVYRNWTVRRHIHVDHKRIVETVQCPCRHSFFRVRHDGSKLDLLLTGM